ncbi:hypothetical protein EUGRSUZ_J01205 [Eucalyptus grandis]|uniref:Uncharacterized protein n=2 Tax=Eucalyptus grandis TaxID=71139 RepID=A0A059ADC8_EUCGR|nr:hypothetical protein EUGRSUZ_J01205 [Eucalyptus grandis]
MLRSFSRALASICAPFPHSFTNTHWIRSPTSPLINTIQLIHEREPIIDHPRHRIVVVVVVVIIIKISEIVVLTLAQPVIAIPRRCIDELPPRRREILHLPVKHRDERLRLRVQARPHPGHQRHLLALRPHRTKQTNKRTNQARNGQKLRNLAKSWRSVTTQEEKIGAFCSPRSNWIFER